MGYHPSELDSYFMFSSEPVSSIEINPSNIISLRTGCFPSVHFYNLHYVNTLFYSSLNLLVPEWAGEAELSM